jgi:predicted RNase H-like HicB family nuclease
MSAESKNSDRRLSRPFAKAVVDQARALARRYQIILMFEDGQWFGRGLELPHVMADGRTPDKCVSATRNALTAAAATMLEAGQSPPAPAQLGQRTQQVNVRLTAEEKALIEGTAKAAGFRGVSDFVRSSALEATKGGAAATVRSFQPARTVRRRSGGSLRRRR